MASLSTSGSGGGKFAPPSTKATGFRGGRGGAMRLPKSDINIPAIIEYYKKNPAEAAKLMAQMAGDQINPGAPVARALKEKDYAGAGLALAAAVPVPGVGAAGKVAGAVGKVAKVAKVAEEAATAAKAVKGARAAGKVAQAVSSDVAKANAAKTAAERATIAAGNRAGKTAEVAATLEQQGAKQAASKSVMSGPKSPVSPRPASGEKYPISDSDFLAQAKARGKALPGKRTPAQEKRAAADLADSFSRARAARESGVRAGEDVPYADGSLPVGNPKVTKAPKAPAVKAPKATEKQAARKKFGETLKRDKAVQAKRDQINLDMAEGKRTSLTDATNPRSKAAKPKAKEAEDFSGLPGSMGRTSGASSSRDAAAKTRKEFLDAGYPADVASKAARKASAQYERGLNKTGLMPTKPFKAAPEAAKAKPETTTKAENPTGESKPAPTPSSPKKTFGSRKESASNVPDMAKNVSSMSKKAMLATGLVAAGGAGIAASNKFGKPSTSKPESASGSKPSASRTFPKTPDSVDRAPKSKAQSDKDKYGSTGQSRFLKGRTAVRESTIQLLRKQGMTKSLARAKDMQGNKEYIEALRRFYGEKRLAKALKG